MGVLQDECISEVSFELRVRARKSQFCPAAVLTLGGPSSSRALAWARPASKPASPNRDRRRRAEEESGLFLEHDRAGEQRRKRAKCHRLSFILTVVVVSTENGFQTGRLPAQQP